MANTEKVIKGLEVCSTGRCEVSCPYHNTSQCTRTILTDALALLKEQEDYKPKGHWMPFEPDKRGYTYGFTCSRCERVIWSYNYCKMIDFDFCPYCGAYMDDSEGR